MEKWTQAAAEMGEAKKTLETLYDDEVDALKRRKRS